MKLKLTPRHFSLAAILFLLCVIVGFSFLSSKEGQEELGGNLLSSLSEDNIPLREISGSYLFHNQQDNKDYVYTIGDASSEISISIIDVKEKKIVNTYFVDIKDKLLDKFAVCRTKSIKTCRQMANLVTTQWEGLYVDPEKRIFLLNEAFGTVVVYDQKVEEITQVINFTRFTKEKIPKEKRNSIDANSLGEGLLPLSNGHILVVKENYPPSIVEFGLKGEKPTGFREDLLVDDSHPFPLRGSRVEMEPLFVWKFPSALNHCDASELAYTKEAGLTLLSQKCQLLLELTELTTKKGTMHFRNFYRLPREIRNAEAFVLLPGKGEFLVFEDKKSLSDKNLHFLSLKRKEKKPNLAKK